MMRRRTILAGALAAAIPRFALAQQPRRVGYLTTGRSSGPLPGLDALRARLGELGWVDGRNVVIEARFAEGDLRRLDGLAAELVRLNAAVIVATGGAAASAAKKATTTIPIVVFISDPVRVGLLSNQARPEGNVTAVSNLAFDLAPKQMELLKEAVPAIKRIAILMGAPADFHDPLRPRILESATRLGVGTYYSEARKLDEYPTAFAAISREGADGLLVMPDPLNGASMTSICRFAATNRIPTIIPYEEWFADGCLLSYGATIGERLRRAADYVDKIFKGAAVGDLPVDQATKFELVVNGRTARMIGVAISPALRLRADRVIE